MNAEIVNETTTSYRCLEYDGNRLEILGEMVVFRDGVTVVRWGEMTLIFPEPQDAQEILEGTWVPREDPNKPPKVFHLDRRRDHSGMSGTGIVADGVEFSDGFCAYRWLTQPRTTQVAETIHDVEHIHGHNGSTRVRWRS